MDTRENAEHVCYLDVYNLRTRQSARIDFIDFPQTWVAIDQEFPVCSGRNITIVKTAKIWTSKTCQLYPKHCIQDKHNT